MHKLGNIYLRYLQEGMKESTSMPQDKKKIKKK